MPKHGNLNIEKLFDQFDQFFVGFEPLFKTTNMSGYPPHNVINKSDNKFILEVACAGFKKADITLSIKDSLLTIIGKKGTEDDLECEYQYRGLASRTFTKSFRIAEFYKVAVVTAKLEDGILSITFEKNSPDDSPAIIIPIN